MKWVRWLYERLNWRVRISGFASQSQESSESDVIGQRLTDVLLQIHLNPRYLQSDWVRENVVFVAAAASMGYITNITHDGYISRQWRVTSMGLKYLEES